MPEDREQNNREKKEYIIVMIVTNKEVKWNHKVQTTGGLHKITTLWATL